MGFPEADSSLAQVYIRQVEHAKLNSTYRPTDVFTLSREQTACPLTSYDQQTSPVGGLQRHCQPRHGRPRDCRQWVAHAVPGTHDHCTCYG